MKRLVLLALIGLIALIVNAQQYDTVYEREENKIVKKIIISKIKLQEGIEINFSDNEIKKLEKGEVVEKEVFGTELPVKLLPVVEIMTPITISSYKKGGNNVVEKIEEKQKLSSPKKSYSVSFFWIYLPFVLVFVVSYLSAKDESKGREKFVVFSIATTLAVMVGIVSGSLADEFTGLIAGIIVGAVAGGITGSFIGKPAGGLVEGFTEDIIGMVAGVSTGLLVGGFAGEFAGKSADLTVLKKYVLIYAGICVTAFLFREAVTRKRKIAEAF